MLACWQMTESTLSLVFQVTSWGTIQSLTSFGRQGWRWNTRPQGRLLAGEQQESVGWRWWPATASPRATLDHRPRLTTGRGAGLQIAFPLRPGARVVKKPLVRWDLVGTSLDLAPKRGEAGLQTGRLGQRLKHTVAGGKGGGLGSVLRIGELNF